MAHEHSAQSWRVVDYWSFLANEYSNLDICENVPSWTKQVIIHGGIEEQKISGEPGTIL